MAAVIFTIFLPAWLLRTKEYGSKVKPVDLISYGVKVKGW